MLTDPEPNLPTTKEPANVHGTLLDRFTNFSSAVFESKRAGLGIMCACSERKP